MMEYCLIYMQTMTLHFLSETIWKIFWQLFPAYLAQSILLYFFAGRLFGKRRKTYKLIFVNIVAIIETACISIALSIAHEHWLDYILVFIVAMTWRTLALHFLYSDKLNRKTAYVLLTQTVMTLSDLLAGMVCFTIDKGVYFNSKNELHMIVWDDYGIYRVFFCTCLKIGELILLLLLCRQLTRLIVAGSAKDWGALNYVSVILCAASMLISILFYDFPMFNVYVPPPVSAALLAAALAGIIVMLRFFPKLRRLIGDVKPAAAVGADICGYGSGSQGNSVRQLQKLRHDVKNNIVTISALIDSGENAEAKRLLNELGERLTSALGGEKATGIAAIDTTLSAKAALCKERGITLDLHAEPLPETKIPPIDLSSVLSNILDNAVEAAEQYPDPVITLRIFKYKMYLAIVCENPITDKPKINGNRFITTKENSRLHGCGTEIISEICRRNNGRAQFEFTENNFKAAAFLEI